MARFYGTVDKNRVGELKKEIAQAAKYLKKEKKLAKQAVKGKGKKLVDKGVKGLSHLKSGLIDLRKSSPLNKKRWLNLSAPGRKNLNLN
jgi:hypothetical protein